MEPDVLRLYASTPPPMDEAAEEEEDDEFGDFGTFGGVPNSLSFTELDTPLTFDPALALNTSSPPEILSRDNSCNGLERRTEPLKVAVNDSLTNGCVADVGSTPFCTNNAHKGQSNHEFADFSAFSNGHSTQTANQDPEQTFHQSEQSSSTEGGATQTECDDFCNDITTVSDAITDVTNGHVDEADASDSTSLGHPLSSMATPPDIGSATPPDLEISTPPDLQISTPPEFQISKPPDICSATPPDLEITMPPDIGSAKPPTFEIFTLPNLEISTPPDIGSATPPNIEISTPPDLEISMLPDIGSATPPDFEISKPHDIVSDKPPNLEISTPPDIVSATPPDLEISTSPDLEISTLPDIASATPPDPDPDTVSALDIDMVTPPDLEISTFKMASPTDLDAAPQDDEDDFGDFGAAELSVELPTPPNCTHTEVQDQDLDSSFPTAFPGSESFGTFSSVQGWSSFSQQDENTWEAFRGEQTLHQPEETHTHTASLNERVQQLFQLFFPLSVSELVDSSVVSLRTLVKEHSSSNRAVWMKLQDVDEAEGLRYVWGGSHCNKALLSSLGIDTRNILFTGQKKQPVIVPMFAAGLGMLEPTKEPVKFVSAAEMITSIGHTTTETHTQQDSLPPVQFDWSSSGLTNPLDANGSSSVLNLDFFGPVEDSGSAPFTGVDPELFDLTTAKMEDSSSRVLDAFSRLMSTMDRTTSTRKLKKTETLSEEASSVLSSLPDLSFMGAKVLMFPSTLTPITH